MSGREGMTDLIPSDRHQVELEIKRSVSSNVRGTSAPGHTLPGASDLEDVRSWYHGCIVSRISRYESSSRGNQVEKTSWRAPTLAVRLHVNMLGIYCVLWLTVADSRPIPPTKYPRVRT